MGVRTIKGVSLTFEFASSRMGKQKFRSSSSISLGARPTELEDESCVLLRERNRVSPGFCVLDMVLVLSESACLERNRLCPGGALSMDARSRERNLPSPAILIAFK